MATIDEVRTGFEQARKEIGLLDEALANEQERIEDQAFQDGGRDLTAEEEARVAAIETARNNLGPSLQKLAMETIDALENASDFDDLLAELDAINQQLTDDLSDLNDLVDVAAKAAKVLGILAKVAEKLIALRPTP